MSSWHKYSVAATLMLVAGCGEEAPEWSEIPTIYLGAGGQASIDLDDYVTDPDNPDEQLLLSVFGGTAATIEASLDASTHVLTLTAANGYDGAVAFEVTATDPDGQSASTTFSSQREDVDPTPTPEPGDIPRRSCDTQFSFNARGANYSSVQVAGQFNDWTPAGSELVDSNGDGIFEADFELAAGRYQYKLVLNGSEWILDPDNAYQAYEGGILNSLVTVEDCTLPEITVVEVDAEGFQPRATLQYHLGSGQSALPVGSVAEITVAGEVVDFNVNRSTGLITVNLPIDGDGKYSIRATPFAQGSEQGTALYWPLWVEEKAFSWNEAILYFTMTDRFNNGETANDAPYGDVDDIADYMGGDWQGITQKIEEGYFEELGIDALWLSPIRDNPNHSEYGADGRLYSGYHGYWPRNNGLEEHFGGVEGLKELVKVAHENNIRIMLDLVANHVHDEHEWWQDNPEWFNEYDFCGDGGSWDLNPVGCWFTDYLPDLDFQEAGALYSMGDVALDLMTVYDLDAIRLDAVKHMDSVFERNLIASVEDQLEVSGVEVYTVGETFTGGWDDSGYSQGLIAEHIGEGLLDGQFDFPLYWEVVETFARRDQGMYELDYLMEVSEDYYGSQALMSNFLGNHDIPRFISHANGDIADVWGNGSQELGWTNPPIQPTHSEPYQRLRLAFTFLMSIEGVPLIYYGDEIGLAGAGDPDNRRMMPWSGLNSHQEETRSHIGALSAIRKAHPALSGGTRTTLWVDGTGYAYGRKSLNDVAVVALYGGNGSKTLNITVSGLGIDDGTVMVDALTGNTVTVEDGILWADLSAYQGAIFVIE